MQSPTSNKRVRPHSDESLDSVEAKRILLDILDESDPNPVSQDLDSFIRTFQDEISPAPESAELTESRQELGFLLEASDDELGLPPTTSTSTGVENNTGEIDDSVELSELWGFDDQMLNGSLEYEYGYGDGNVNGGEYVALDGLFDDGEIGFGSSELTWQPETLPAQ